MINSIVNPTSVVNRSPTRTISSQSHHRTSSINSSSFTNISLAEKRKTKISEYLESKDFKADFANKLQNVRQRELARDEIKLDSIHSNLSSSSSSTISSNTSSSTISILNSTCSSSTLTTSSLSHFNLHSDSNLINNSSNPSKDQIHDPEEDNARNEVIRTLADQLAKQLETNDSLLYDLGVLRSNYARLQSLLTDKDDQIHYLDQKNQKLQSLLNQSNSINHSNQSNSNQIIQSLNHQLDQSHHVLCRLHLHHTNQNHLHSLNSPKKLDQNISQLKRRSWSYSTQTFQSINNFSNHPSLELNQSKNPSCNPPIHHHGHINQGSHILSLQNQINQLQTELANCEEVKLSCQVTLDAFVELSKNHKDKQTLSCSHAQSLDPKPDPTHTQDQIPIKRWGLGILSGRSSSVSSHDSPTIVSDNPTKSAHTESTASHQTNSPLKAITNLSFGSRWSRKADSISLNNESSLDDTSPSELKSTPAFNNDKSDIPRSFGFASLFGNVVNTNQKTNSYSSRPRLSLTSSDYLSSTEEKSIEGSKLNNKLIGLDICQKIKS